ncbi:LacI family DNA-binding transcriptional regulator [Dactylosporangium sp. CA-139066]|uniref:LacI family DNA-binding transcriptional regulator n=1 Tax=Dactylosporangium sp. CA-139066 TaxID=3239930 RepID=UPI003D90BEC3
MASLLVMNVGRPTIEDVARAAGVSRATVSRVINNEPGASGALRARVQEAVAALGYLPNESARALASGRVRAVDVVAVNYSAIGWLGTHPYYSRVLAGAMSVVENADVQLRVHAVNQHSGAEEAIDAIAQQVTVGALLANVTPELAARFHRRCRRVVSLVATAPAVPAFEADNGQGTYAAVEHLHRLGRRRIAAVHGPEGNTCAIDRREGYRRAVKDLGLEEIGDGGDFLREDGYAAAQRLLARRPDIDAMFVACDLMGAGAVQAITASGRTVPRDVSVVGFDDSIAAVCANPPLSTMRMPVEEMAAEATRLLLEGTPATGLRRRFPVELIERASTFR